MNLSISTNMSSTNELSENDILKTNTSNSEINEITNIGDINTIKVPYFDMDSWNNFCDLSFDNFLCRKIVDINVIVPNKVVEITFGDDKKEKMVCHKDDKFDLRKCCFIAIAKHLYKEEFTFEGIEYMAERLMYQKKYVKIVKDALRNYRKKEEEKEKKLREEEESKIIRDRQRLKRRKKKEERAQRHREILVDLIADSINEAKVRRKDNK